jgi:DDE superfamily endonuclease
MHTLPTAMVQLLAPFTLLFSERVWRHAQVLLVGTILAPGKRTVGAALRVMGLGRTEQYQRYYRVLNRAVWSSREASRVLLGLLVKTFLPEGKPRWSSAWTKPWRGVGGPRSPPRGSIGT